MKTGSVIRVMVVDDQYIVRSGLSTFVSLYSEFELIGEAQNGAEAVSLCGQLQPHVILMDLMMPVMNGVAATREILRLYPNVKVLALTSFKEKDLVHDVLQAGAIGYMLKDASADELFDAIHRVHSGRTALSPEAMQALLEKSRADAQPALGADLTEREHDVLRLMVEGDSNPEIAEKLVLSLSTVKTHVSNILSKLQATTRTEAVTLALKNKIQ